MELANPQEVLLGTVVSPQESAAETVKMLNELEADQAARELAYDRAMSPLPQDDDDE